MGMISASLAPHLLCVSIHTRTSPHAPTHPPPAGNTKAVMAGEAPPLLRVLAKVLWGDTDRVCISSSAGATPGLPRVRSPSPTHIHASIQLRAQIQAQAQSRTQTQAPAWTQIPVHSTKNICRTFIKQCLCG